MLLGEFLNLFDDDNVVLENITVLEQLQMLNNFIQLLIEEQIALISPRLIIFFDLFNMMHFINYQAGSIVKFKTIDCSTGLLLRQILPLL